MGKHNYPKNRKPNENSETQRLLKLHGEEYLRETWEKQGMYRAATTLETSPFVIRYLSNKYGWKRIYDKTSTPLYKGIINGKLDANKFKHLIFDLEEANEKPQA